MTALSNHVPDPRLITAVAEQQDGPLHRVNPWTKVSVLGALVLAVTVFDRLWLLASVYTLVVGVYAVAGLSLRRLLGWYSLPALFLVSVAVPLAFFEPGRPIVGALQTPLGAVSVTWAGLTLLAELSLRSLTVVTFSLATAMTTRYVDVAYLLGRLLPRPLDQVTLLAYRFTFEMVETLEALLKAARSRGADLSVFWTHRRLYARVVGATFLSAIERSERLVTSMQARGYDGEFIPSGTVARPPPRELLVVVASYAVVVGYTVVGGYATVSGFAMVVDHAMIGGYGMVVVDTVGTALSLLAGDGQVILPWQSQLVPVESLPLTTVEPLPLTAVEPLPPTTVEPLPVTVEVRA
jgi:cobalt/nickel transport system permease protein